MDKESLIRLIGRVPADNPLDRAALLDIHLCSIPITTKAREWKETIILLTEYLQGLEWPPTSSVVFDIKTLNGMPLEAILELQKKRLAFYRSTRPEWVEAYGRMKLDN